MNVSVRSVTPTHWDREPATPPHTHDSRESSVAAGNQHSQPRTSSTLRAACNSRRDNTEGRERRGNGEGVARGVMGENQSCNDRVKEKDGIDVGRSRKRKPRESVSLPRLMRSCRGVYNH